MSSSARSSCNSSTSSTARTDRKRKRDSSSSSDGDFRIVKGGSGSVSTNSTPASALGRTPKMHVQLLGSTERENKKFQRFVQNMPNERFGLASFVMPGRVQPDHILMLTDKTGRVKGYAACDGEGDDMHVSSLYVKKQARGGGKKLMEGVMGLARDKGKWRVSLESLPEAVDFYTKLGYAKQRSRWRAHLMPMSKAV